MNPQVESFFDDGTNTVSYVVRDPSTNLCVVIDPVLDYSPESGRTSTASADRIIRYLNEQDLQVKNILETHAHADHLSAASYLKAHVGGVTAIGENIKQVQSSFSKLFNIEKGFPVDGSQFDLLLADGEQINVGQLTITILHTPGHTPACVTYIIGNAAFVGDTLFMPDYGTARTDFPGGDAATLFQSIQKILTLPESTRLYLCHDYKAPGRAQFCWETTVAEEKANNIHVGSGVTESDFVTMREARDATLEMPTLLLPSVQVNIRAGATPPAEDNGVSYLKIPIDQL